MYNYYQQQQNNALNRISLGTLKGHPVSSLEEVRATSIDFDGSIFYFPDIANKRIYTKTIGLDGIANLNMYELKPLPQDNFTPGDFITRQEFDKAMERVSELFANIKPTQPEQPSTANFKEVF